ncbi:MAG: dihydrofolate reductase [Gammaproteobacteria bacterium]|nr:dihydrofolate reductase [Gammaproteobacteria bacterium]|tara:strand:+ start:6970 stop:7476 length:507 start_codon:yes stop_codon:yes gene_type:complete
MITISHVVALSNNNVIGVDNNLPWNLKTDLKHFREYTTNKIIIMGRKTYDSIGRVLPNRTNYVVSRTIKEIDGGFVFNSTENAIKDAIEVCNKKEMNEIVIIGGGYLFDETMPIVNKLVLTKVDCNIKGDVFYPEIDIDKWELVSTESFYMDEENDYNFTVEVLKKLT